MTVEAITALLNDHDDGMFLMFDDIPPERRLSNRPDLHAFLLLDRLVPGKKDMVCSAEHDQLWLDVSLEDLAAVATPEDIMDLKRCGVMEDEDSLAMFA